MKIPKMGNITQKWVSLLLPFTNNYGGRFSGTELSKFSGIPQQTASRLLNDLVNQNVLDFYENGRNKIFYLDHTKNKVKSVFEILENHKTLTFHQKLKEVSLIVEEVAKHSESVIIFGSYSSYKFHKTSDLDVVFLGKQEKGSIDKVRNKQNIEINGYYMSYSEFSKKLKDKNPLAVEIMKNHTIFGDVSKVVDIFLEATE